MAAQTKTKKPALESTEQLLAKLRAYGASGRKANLADTIGLLTGRSYCDPFYMDDDDLRLALEATAPSPYGRTRYDQLWEQAVDALGRVLAANPGHRVGQAVSNITSLFQTVYPGELPNDRQFVRAADWYLGGDKPFFDVGEVIAEPWVLVAPHDVCVGSLRARAEGGHVFANISCISREILAGTRRHMSMPTRPDLKCEGELLAKLVQVDPNIAIDFRRGAEDDLLDLLTDPAKADELAKFPEWERDQWVTGFLTGHAFDHWDILVGHFVPLIRERVDGAAAQHYVLWNLFHGSKI